MDAMTAQHFAATRDSLKGRHATIAALIDFAEGNPFALYSDPWVYDALEERGLVKSNLIDWQYWEKIGMKPPDTPLTELTDYGKGFVAWYRQPRDLPAQLDMFDVLD